jgi:hypothetical protein
MTNLVQLHLDKDTGEVIAKSITGGGGGGLTNVFGYVHYQYIEDTTWVIEHNGNTTFVVVQIFDTDERLILPDDIDIIDANTIHVKFTAVLDGRAHVLLFK